MADDLSLLFKIRGDATGAKTATAEARAAIASLRTSFGSEMGAMQRASKSAFSSIGDNLNVLVGQQIPIVGNAFIKLTDGLKGLGTTAATTGEGLEVAGEGAAAAGSEIAAMAGPIGIAIVAVGALAAAGALLAKGLFNLAEQAAEFRGKMFDLSQQTGVSVETLSALEIVAKTTGGSIESIAQSLVIFQGKLDEAQDASSKAGKKFAELGISVDETEQSFREALAVIAKMPVGFEQTNTAAELFGKRGGKQVLAILKELHGDLDGAIDRFREMGIIISTEDAKAADDFNDQLALLNFQFRAMVGKEAIPAVLSAMRALSETLENNQEGVQGLGIAVGGLAFAFGSQLVTSLGLVNSFFQSAVVTGQKLREVYDGIAEALGLINSLSRATGGAGGISEPQGTAAGGGNLPGIHQQGADEAALAKGRSGASKTAAAVESRAAKEIAIAQQDLENSTRFHRERLQRERDQDLIDTQKWVEESLAQSKKHLEEEQKLFEQERENVRQFVKNRADRAIALAEIDAKERQASTDSGLERQRIRDEGAKRELEAQIKFNKQELALNEQLASIRDAQRQGEQQRIDAALENGNITQMEALERELALLKDAQEARVVLIDLELNQLTTSAERKIALDNEKIESEQKYTNAVEELTQRRLRAQFDEDNAAAKGKTRKRRTTDPDQEESGMFDIDLEQFAKDTKESVVKANELLADSFHQVADAIGSVVEQWVLYGETGPAVMRKILASALATLAKEATINALKMLAVGFAELALHDYDAARNAFTSAAIWGVVAGGAAVAGRAIAGNSFNQQGDKGGGRSSTGGGGALDTIERPRNQQMVVRHEHVLRVESNDSHIVRVIGKNWRDGGEIRELVFNDGG